eukprot:COSAG06_NODE_2678_length_6460_cov_2.134884_8_plen_75_part_00
MLATLCKQSREEIGRDRGARRNPPGPYLALSAALLEQQLDPFHHVTPALQGLQHEGRLPRYVGRLEGDGSPPPQ